MGHEKRAILMAAAIAGVVAFSASASAADAIDADAAKALAKKDHCLRCHGIDKKKEGPTYHAIAYKYQGQADALDKLVKHITSGEDRVKLSDGHMEDHKVDKSSSPEQVRNLIGWILAQ
jgi:cytochrome c